MFVLVGVFVDCDIFITAIIISAFKHHDHGWVAHKYDAKTFC